jgi:hypothetical protein
VALQVEALANTASCAPLLLTGPARPAADVALQVEALAKKHLEEYVLQKWEDTSAKCPMQSYANVCYTPKGLAYYSDWGTLRNTGNMMLIAALTGKLTEKSSHK